MVYLYAVVELAVSCYRSGATLSANCVLDEHNDAPGNRALPIPIADSKEKILVLLEC